MGRGLETTSGFVVLLCSAVVSGDGFVNVFPWRTGCENFLFSFGFRVANGIDFSYYLLKGS